MQLLTVCFPGTNFATFSWQLNGFVTIKFWTFVFDIFALDSSHNSSFFCYLQREKNTTKMLKNWCKLINKDLNFKLIYIFR